MKQVIRHVIPQEIFVKTNKFVAMVYFESFRSSLACSSPHPAEILEWDLATHCAKLFKGKTFCLLHRDESSFYLFLPWLASVLDVLVGRFFLHFPHKKRRHIWVSKSWRPKISLCCWLRSALLPFVSFQFLVFLLATTTTTFSITWKIEKPRN